jgi:hypothetical protein
MPNLKKQELKFGQKDKGVKKTAKENASPTSDDEQCNISNINPRGNMQGLQE